jgi:hypothetical protein
MNPLPIDDSARRSTRIKARRVQALLYSAPPLESEDIFFSVEEAARVLLTLWHARDRSSRVNSTAVKKTSPHCTHKRVN